MRPVRLAVLFGILPLMWGQAARAAAPRPLIASGTFTSGFPSAGALLAGGDPETAVSWCSGVLIGCQTFLTAAHCVCGRTGRACQGAAAPDPDGRLVYLQHAGFFRVASIRVHPAYRFPVGDVAIVKLAEPVTGIAPSRINLTPPPRVAPGIIVGFGRGGGEASDYGLKRWGRVTTAPCRDGISNATSVCWTFDGTGSNTCNGDSGGPLFMDLGDGPVVAGVTSGGENETCLPDDFDYDANVYRYRSWIIAQAGDDLGARCGGLPAAGEAGTAIARFTGTLDSTVREGRHVLDVPAGMNELRIALHGADDGAADFDLYVRAGSPPTTSSYDCRSRGPSQYGFCRLLFPAAGPWHVLAFRKSGGGAYQLTATIFGGDPPACGNGVRETGEECDGDDAPLCPGACASDCRCVSLCAGVGLLPVQMRLGRRALVKAVLLDGGADGAPIDPIVSGLEVTLDGGDRPLRVAIPAGDARWRAPASARGTWEWRGPAADGARIVVRCRRLPPGGWQIAVRGRGGDQ
jgi:hypothetical protein